MLSKVSQKKNREQIIHYSFNVYVVCKSMSVCIVLVSTLFFFYMDPLV